MTTIAVAGKGGTGKTTLAALAVQYLVRRGETPVLAVDADPNSNLGQTLGIGVPITVGSAREQGFAGERAIPGGMTKDQFVEYKIQEALAEGEGFDLLTMGRPEGAGCYCFANNIIRRYMDALAGDYRHVVMDNEAGLEHISRRTTRKTDVLMLVADAGVRGIQAARRVLDLAVEMKLEVGRTVFVLNRASEAAVAALMPEIERLELPLVATVPEDPGLFEAEVAGKSLLEIAGESPAVAAAAALFDGVFGLQG
ncbi:MAG: AAA family ATPase [Actinomycetota bacterium]|jgi:CO dehydrogenase maturation factor|nr:AAA family ATPase [Actinomycetota bacterium]MCL6093403.1 AAA family ATPase [Actinomycetota bacterium]MDA8167645.1 AAA family ATPase [Actinomycetota bacterium]